MLDNKIFWAAAMDEMAKTAGIGSKIISGVKRYKQLLTGSKARKMADSTMRFAERSGQKASGVVGKGAQGVYVNKAKEILGRRVAKITGERLKSIGTQAATGGAVLYGAKKAID